LRHEPEIALKASAKTHILFISRRLALCALGTKKLYWSQPGRCFTHRDRQRI